MMWDRPHQRLVEAAVESLTARRCAAEAAPVEVSLDALYRTCSAAAAALELDLGDKRRSQLDDAARHAAAYLRFLQPPAGWRRCRPVSDATVVWGDDVRVFADVVLATGRGAAVWTRQISGRPRRVLAAGRQLHGDRFVGVRLVAVAAPTRSMLVEGSRGTPRPLHGSAWWFQPAVTDGFELAVAASGGEVS